MAASPSSDSHSGADSHHHHRRRRHHPRKHHHRHRSEKTSITASSGSSSSAESDCSVQSAGNRQLDRKKHGKRKLRLEFDSSTENDSDGPEYARKKRRKDRSKKGRDKGKEKHLKHKHEKHKQKENKDIPGPVQLSKFLNHVKDDGVRRSAVSGKKILMKIEKTKEDRLAENNRNELLKFLNASYN